jgi:hypothetical protein
MPRGRVGLTGLHGEPVEQKGLVPLQRLILGLQSWNRAWILAQQRLWTPILSVEGALAG